MNHVLKFLEIGAACGGRRRGGKRLWRFEQFKFCFRSAIFLPFEVYQPLSAKGLSWFYGAGAYVGFESDSDKNGEGGGRTFAGPTGIIGLDYKFSNAPINLSLDWKPELNIIPAINFVPDAFALSVRFAFGK